MQLNRRKSSTTSRKYARARRRREAGFPFNEINGRYVAYPVVLLTVCGVRTIPDLPARTAEIALYRCRKEVKILFEKNRAKGCQKNLKSTGFCTINMLKYK